MQKRKRDKPKKSENRVNTPPFIVGMMIGCFSFVVLVMLVCILSLVVYVVAVKIDYHNSTVAYYMRLLDDELVHDLCSKNLVPDSIVDCNQSEVIIRYFQMQEIMTYHLNQKLIYSEVYSRFGIYEVLCNLPDRPSKPNTYRCAYEFQVAYTLVFVFDENTHEFLEIE